MNEVTVVSPWVGIGFSHHLSWLKGNMWLIASQVQYVKFISNSFTKWRYFQKYTHPSKTENRCRGTTPSHAESTPPRGLATKTTLHFITVSQLNAKEEKQRWRGSERETIRNKQTGRCCLRYTQYSLTVVCGYSHEQTAVSPELFESNYSEPDYQFLHTVNLLFMKPIHIFYKPRDSLRMKRRLLLSANYIQQQMH